LQQQQQLIATKMPKRNKAKARHRADSNKGIFDSFLLCISYFVLLQIVATWHIANSLFPFFLSSSSLQKIAGTTKVLQPRLRVLNAATRLLL